MRADRKLTVVPPIVATQLFLGFWTSQSIPGFGQAEYIGIYAGLGIANGVFSFLLAFIIR